MSKAKEWPFVLAFLGAILIGAGADSGIATLGALLLAVGLLERMDER
jgi:hypothetical protein